jgi:hypothetical protein
MGKGADNSMGAGPPLPFTRKYSFSGSLEGLKQIGDLKDDLLVLKHLWFSKAGKITDHKARLDSFYGPQAAACECVDGLLGDKSVCNLFVLLLIFERPSITRR